MPTSVPKNYKTYFIQFLMPLLSRISLTFSCGSRLVATLRNQHRVLLLYKLNFIQARQFELARLWINNTLDGTTGSLFHCQRPLGS